MSLRSLKNNNSPPPPPSNISVTTTNTSPLVNADLSNAIKNIISATLENYPNNFFAVNDDITYARINLYTAAVSLHDLVLMTKIKNALSLNHGFDVDIMANQLINLLNTPDEELANVFSFGERIRANEDVNIAKLRDFCDIVDFFYHIESIRRDILSNSYGGNFNVLSTQLNMVYVMASAINNSGTCSDNSNFVTAVNYLQSLVSAIGDHNLSTIIALNDHLKNNDPEIGSLSDYFTELERNELINAITTTYSLP